MRRVLGGLLIGLALATGAGAGAACAQPTSGPQGRPVDGSGRQLWLIPSQDRSVLMRASVFRPDGPGPFPLVVVNHGSTQNEIVRLSYPVPVFGTISHWFRERGYAVVVPQRPGHGETGGLYLEDQRGCDRADYFASGIATASSIQAAIDYMTAQAFVRRDGVLVVGHSAGGWGTLALASTNPRSVKAAINFAGGRGGRVDSKPNNNCAPDRLVEAAGRFGSTARVPTLWLYVENDSFFPPSLSKRMAQTFRTAGGRVDFHLLPPFGREGHVLMEDRDGVAAWGPIVAPFLARVR